MSQLHPLSPRRKTRQIMVGKVAVGGDAPITVQSMTKTDTRDVEATVAQIYSYAAAGCEIVRVSVPTKKAADAFPEICARSPIPVVADIHFDYRLALAAADGGAACLRINPGNIGGQDRVRAVVDKAGEKGLSIRIGVNGGSLEKDLLEKFGTATPEAMVESALRHLEMLEKEGFYQTKISKGKRRHPNGPSLSPSGQAGRLPLPSGNYRGRYSLWRNHSFQYWPRYPPRRRYWRYHPGFLDGRWRRRIQNWARNAPCARASFGWNSYGELSQLWPCPD